MKKSFMTRALATGLSLAMAFSLSAATNVTVASAASTPAMASKQFAVRVGGATKTYKASAATLKKYKITKATVGNSSKATVAVAASKKGIKVTPGTVSGSTVVKVTFRNTKTKKSTTKKYRCVVKAAVQPVDETTKISTVKQNTFTEFTVTMSKALEKVAAANFTMVRDDDNQVITVKSATLDAQDKTQVKMTVYTSLTDAKTYTVTYTADDEAKTQSTAKITVTDGVVADVAITPLEITANKETLIEYQTLDANGVIISQKGASKTANNVDVSWDSLLGTMDENTSKYILYNVGDTAKFTVTYHTYKYDATTGAETGVITKDFTITAVKDASVVSQYVYTAALDGDKPFSWSTVAPKQTIAVDDTGDMQRRAYFLIKNSKGEDVTSDCGYTVESSDNSIVVADGDVKDGALLSPVAKGSAYLMVKDTDGNVVNTMPITVGDKRTISTFKLSAQSVNVASGTAVASQAACVYTDLVAKDQYGEDIKADALTLVIDEERSTNPATADVDLPVDCGIAGSIRVAAGTTPEKKSATYIIKATDKLNKTMTTTLRVNIVVPSTGAKTYSIVFTDDSNNNKVISSIDTTISEKMGDTTFNAKTLSAHVVAKQGGVVVDEIANVTAQAIKVTKNDGTVVAASGTGVKTTTSAAIDGTAIGNAIGSAIAGNALDIKVTEGTAVDAANAAAKNLGAGTYTVVYELKNVTGDAKTPNRIDRASASFTVVDKQTPVTIKVNETNCNNVSNLEEVLTPDKFVEYYYGDVKLKSADVAVVSNGVKYTVSNGAKNAYVKEVTLTVKVADTSKYMKIVIPVNKTFTTNAGWPIPS